MLNSLARLAQSRGGRALVVGGFVRDKMLGKPSKDIDVEIYGIPPSDIPGLLGGNIELCGESFGVWKWNGMDISIPRREKSTGDSHKDFLVDCDPSMTPEQACLRRDFTINAIALDPLTNELIDPVNGVYDLKQGILKHVGPQFAEDPLRVLRGMQFCARFRLTPAWSTIQLCKSLRDAEHTLPPERVWEEWRKWAAKGDYPSLGLKFLRLVHWMPVDFEAMYTAEQDPKWHPEGNVGVHTEFVCDEAALIARRDLLSEEDREILVLGALFHDIGKPSTTYANDEGRWISPRHQFVGADFTQEFLRDTWKVPTKVNKKVCELVRLHMWGKDVSERAIRRFLHLHLKENSIEQWARLVEADSSGRPPLPKGLPSSVVPFLEACKEFLRNQKPVPLVLGRHLLELGYVPGIEMGVKLKELYAMQIEDGLNFEQLIERVKLIPLTGEVGTNLTGYMETKFIPRSSGRVL